MTSTGALFLATSIRSTDDHFSQIERALAEVSEDDVWRRSNDASNSLGNLLLHLAGSHRFWIASVVGGQPNARVRQLEFDTRSGILRSELLERLRMAVTDANRVLTTLTEETLGDERQALDKTWTVLGAIHHSVTHFALHTGQILQLVKAYVGRDLGLRP